MVNGRANTALRQVARVFHDGTLAGLSDRQILERFVDRRDDTAFEGLIVRHGPMVLNVCRQLLRDPHDVEDAFQTVFLVLVRKARGVRVEGSLGPWLYAVANRVAARARANRRRIQAREISACVELAASMPDKAFDRLELAGVIQEELGRLPERLRAPVVLCYLQGMTHELAAGQLGCPVGTVRSRLSRARAQLLARMTRRGLTLSAAALVSALEPSSSAAAIPPIVRTKLIKLAIRSVSESASTVGGLGASASVAALLEGVLNVMRIKKLAITAVGLVALGTLSLVIANRAAAVNGSPFQEQVRRNDEPLARRVGPDDTAIGSPKAIPRTESITKTYYVGDILGTEPRFMAGSTSVSVPGQPPAGVRASVDMKPITDFIASTVAPGTWKTGDAIKNVDTSKTLAPIDVRTIDPILRDDTSSWNVMVPFQPSIGLIIKGTPEVHDQVGNTLRRLRVLLQARDERTRPSPAEPPKSPQPGSRQRVQQLLEELQREVAKFPPHET
jgi:RNA polymerase sigma factor (sigma-70 family)